MGVTQSVVLPLVVSARGLGMAAPDAPALARGLSCPDCSSGQMTRTLLTLTDGAPVDIVCCQSCDYHAWRFTDGTLELDDVLTGFAGQQALFPG